MNVRFDGTPEVIATVSTMRDGTQNLFKDRVLGVSVSRNRQGVGVVELDVRGFQRDINLILTVELSEIMAALAHATLNRTVE